MPDAAQTDTLMAVLGTGLCIPDEQAAAACGFSDCGLDASLLPPLVRRRTSLATRMAVCAADRACASAGVDRGLSAVFVSAAGEMQVTDRLCTAIARREYPLSPTLFHNSVHNTAAGYWSMATGSMAPMQAMAALDDGFALGLLEAWCQLQAGVGQVLLVVYDEALPAELLPDYHWQSCALGLVLGAGVAGRPGIAAPFRSAALARGTDTARLKAANPAMVGVEVLRLLERASPGRHRIALSGDAPAWMTDVEPGPA
jgi:hypothetical protein